MPSPQELQARVSQELRRAEGFAQLEDNLLIDEDELQAQIDQFLKLFSTGQAQTQNRLSENAARGNVSPQALAAQIRGTGVQGNLAAGQGVDAIRTNAQNFNAGNSRFILGSAQQEKQFQQARDDQKRAQMFQLFSSLASLGGRAAASSIGG